MAEALGISFFQCVCALGRTADEVWSRWMSQGPSPLVPWAQRGIPDRVVLFGAVQDPLPAIADPVYDCRTNRLLAHLVESARVSFSSLIARYGKHRIAIVLGSSNTGVHEAMSLVGDWLDAAQCPQRMRLSLLEVGNPAEFLARHLGITGPAYVVSTACSSSAKVFDAARRLIVSGVVDAAIVGGADGACRFALNGFHALGALAAGYAHPFSRDCDGINLGEGAALFALTCEPSPVGLTFLGAGESSDAYHPTAPDPTGQGAECAIRRALAEAASSPDDVDYVNLHGTGTKANDSMERNAVMRVWSNAYLANGVANNAIRECTRPFCESTKPLTGHCLGAAGAIEAALVCLKLLRDSQVHLAISNSFGFGGTNSTLAFKCKMKSV